MQTTTLPIQANGAAPSPQRASAAPNLDAGQFSAALSREIEQRQDTAPPPAAPAPQARTAARPDQQQADAPPQADAKAPPQDAARPDQAKPASKAAKADDTADADAGKDDAAPAGHPDTAHVTDMLALVASLKPQQAGASAKAAGEHAGAGALAATAKPGTQAAQLAALQAAFKALDKDGAAAGKPLAAPGAAADPAGAGAAAAAALGAPGAADGAAGAKGAADFRALQEAAAGQLKAHAGAAPARDAAADLAALKEPAPAAPLLAQVQPVTLEMAQAVAGAAGERIAARVGTPAWDNQVGQKIVWMAAGEEHSASLTLNPPDLGPLQVVLSVTNDQASVTFSSNQLEVRQALENALPRLREMMGESGIALGNATVNAGMPDQRQAQGGEQPRGGAGGSGRFDGGGAIAEPALRPGARTTIIGERGVDTFA